MELTSLSIREAAQRLSSGELSPLELTQAFLDRIARLDPQLNSYLNLTAEAALEQVQTNALTINQPRKYALTPINRDQEGQDTQPDQVPAHHVRYPVCAQINP